jgi:hypothetical protein
MNGLERRYRRLLAWYPTWFRLQNEEEILAVLLACARTGSGGPASSRHYRTSMRNRSSLA